jgi:hypothetical protein
VSNGEAVKLLDTGEVGFVTGRAPDGRGYVIRFSGPRGERDETRARGEFRLENNFMRVMQALAAGGHQGLLAVHPLGRQPARGHTPIHAPGGDVIGEVTSGGFGPSANGPVAMGYVARAQAADGTPVELMVRGKPLPARIAPLPFIPHRYAR